MENEKFDLIFKGELVPGFELAQVKQNLQQLFRIDAVQVEKLFVGTPIVLKKGLDADAANKYRVALKKAGARLQVQASVSEVAEPPSRPAAAVSRPQNQPPLKPQKEPVRRAGDWGRAIEAPNYGVAAAGSDLLRDDEKAAVVAVELDLSAISVAPMQGELLAEHERPVKKSADVVVPDLDVLPAGSDLLSESERGSPADAAIDTSGLTIAEPGVRLSEPGPKPPAAPDVKHIRLQD